MSQAWVEGEILHPDCQLKLARALSCVLGQCVKVLLLEELRVTLLESITIMHQCLAGAPSALCGAGPWQTPMAVL